MPGGTPPRTPNVGDVYVSPTPPNVRFDLKHPALSSSIEFSSDGCRNCATKPVDGSGVGVEIVVQT
jgi:hypothetical protein